MSAIQITILVVVGLLSFASVCTLLLLLWKPKNETFLKVKVIIKSWWIIAVVFLAALSWQRWGILILMYVVSVFSVREYLKVSRVPYKNYLIIVLTLLCSLQYFFILRGNLELFLSALPVLCLWIVPALVIFRAQINNIELVTAVGLGLCLVLYYVSHIAAISNFSQLKLTPDETTFAILLLILTTWSNDVFQFIAGKSFGRRKIVPQVSPNKTLAGFIGGIVGTTLLTCLTMTKLLNLQIKQAVLLGIIMGITGMFGDLFFSAIKRKIGIKDFSQVLPGHGGLLDRLDSLIFTAPIYFHFLLQVKG